MTKEAVSPKKHPSPRSRWWVGIILLMIIGGYFWLNPPGVITQRVAEKYLSDSSKIKLSEYSSITDEAAQGLALFKGYKLSLDGLTTLSDEAAKSLAQFKGSGLSLDGLTTLSPEAAKALAQFKGNRLHLNGLATLSPETAQALYRSRAYINLPAVTSAEIRSILDAKRVLSEESQKQFGVEYLDEVSPKQIKEIEQLTHAVAKDLSYGGELELKLAMVNVKSLTKETAHELSYYTGDRLALGVTELPADVARSLSPNPWLGRRGSTDLPNLRAISEEAAQALAQFKSLTLDLNGLTTLSDEAAKALAQFKGRHLSLGGLTSLSPEAAKALAQFEEVTLSLDGLTSLSEEVAKALAKFKSNLGGREEELSLNGLTDLSPEAAKSLAQFQGYELHLDGLTTLSEEAAKALAKFKGIYLGLNGLATLSPEAANALAQFKGQHLYLNGLTTLSPEAAQALAQFEGAWLSLDGLTDLSPETLQALAQFKGYFHLKGLTTLSPEAAQALAQFRGEYLYLNRLTDLSPETAQALAQFRGYGLHLDGLTTLSPEAAKALAQFKGRVLYLNGLTTLSDEAAKALAQFQVKYLSLDSLTATKIRLESGIAQSGELTIQRHRELNSLVVENSYLIEVKKDQRYSITISQRGNDFEESEGVIPAFNLVDAENESLLGDSDFISVAGTDGGYIGLDFSRTAVRALEQLTETYGLVSVERLTEEKTKLTFTANTDGELQLTLVLVAPVPGGDEANGSWEYRILFDHDINR